MDLTAAVPFRLGEFEVTPSRCEIARGETVARVEPKVMAVLLALAARRGKTVSRETLFEEVWDGRAVTDDALTRCISALRRIFRDSPSVEIKALPKLGYILVADAAAAAPLRTTTQNERATRSPALFVAAAGVAFALATTAVLSFGDNSQRTAVAGGQVRPLTAMPGLELYPALSPAGGQVAFAHKDTSGRWDLYLKSLAGGEPQRLTDDVARERLPVWSRAGDELAYVRSDGEACEIIRVAVPGGTARKIADCGAKLVGSLDWSPDGKLLVLTRSDERLAPGRLAFIALEGAPPSFILEPALSAEDARFSRDGRSLALTLSSAIGAEDIYTLDMATGALERITHDNAKIHGLDWSGLGVIYGSNRGGSFGLHRASLNGGRPTSLLPSLQDIENPSVVNNRVAYEAWTETGGLNVFAPNKGSPTLPPDSTRLEWHPDIARDGAIAFVSDRDGAPEVWLSKDGKVRQLTAFGDAYIHTAKFSPDGARIAFSAPRDGHFNLFLVDREGRQTRLTDGAANDMSPAWSKDGRTLYFASDRGGSWRIWRHDIETGAQTAISNISARAVYVLDESNLLTVDPQRGGLTRIAIDGKQTPIRLIDNLAPSDWANVAVSGNQVFYISREPPDRAVLRRFDLDTRKDEALSDLEDFYFRSGLTVADGAIVYATTRVEDVSLMLFEEYRLTADAE